jgi:hypothetical protein
MKPRIGIDASKAPGKRMLQPASVVQLLWGRFHQFTEFDNDRIGSRWCKPPALGAIYHYFMCPVALLLNAPT